MRIEGRNISKSFGSQVVLSGFNLVVETGEMVAITGVSGSGKTTLLNILGLIEKPDTGEILFDDRPITSARQRRRLLGAAIGFIFQDFGLIEDETVLGNLSLVRQLSGISSKEKRARIESALEAVGLPRQYCEKVPYLQSVVFPLS